VGVFKKDSDMKKIYKVRAGTTFNDKDARIIGAFLDTKFPGGMYSPKEVVEAAKPKNSPIHRYFEWDKDKAAYLYNLQQARRLITCL
jgi:hypothetical protein